MIYTVSTNQLLAMAARHSEQFLREQLNRQDFLRKHPVQIAGISCMDGRTKLSAIFGLRFGFIRRQWRTLAGVVDLGAPRFRASVDNWRSYAKQNDQDSLVFVSYHYSGRNDAQLGCRGHHHNKDRALAAALKIYEQFVRVYGETMPCPVVIGIDTDFETVYVHDQKGSIIDASSFVNQPEADIVECLAGGFPSMPKTVLEVLALAVKGNAVHTSGLKAAKRPIEEAQHHEYALVVGEGMWTEPNSAIVVGPYTLDFGESIGVAAGLLSDNFDKGRANGNDPVLLSCAVFRDSEIARRGAIEEARCFLDYSQQVIAKQVPDFAKRLIYHASVLDLNNRLVELV
ncbi:MAG: carboxysome shell carbonic anhydrase [Patescibacteria group bacterium]|nr:carboxysome shell carbonic anhydrase [Patescibacteria group bacterium]